MPKPRRHHRASQASSWGCRSSTARPCHLKQGLHVPFRAALRSLLLLVSQRKEECFVLWPKDEFDTAPTSPADLL